MESQTTLSALLITAMVSGVIHTISGPDHYLPFIAIAKSRNYGWFKTLMWTFICGMGHVGSALVLAGGFLLFAELLSENRLEWLERWRGDIAAYALVGMGAAILIHALYARWKKQPHFHKHIHCDGTVMVHQHDLAHDHDHSQEKSLSYWVLFIIFVFGPCEALLPVLTVSAVLGTASVVLIATVFSVATILTMLAAVTLGVLGLNTLRIAWMERFSSEIAGGTLMACGLAILCLGL